MRKINKGQAIDVFTDFVRRHPTAVWNDFVTQKNDDSLDTRYHILTEEQDCQCGYTELLIDLDNSHIDHYIKQDIEANRTFDWNNLIVALGNSKFGVNPDFGAHYKDSRYKIKQHEYVNIFNPVEDDVQSYFHYNDFGKIEPLPTLADERIKLKVVKTREVFNLDHPSLVDRRKDLINMIKSCKQGGMDYEDIKDYLSSMGFKSLIEQYCG